MTLITCSECKKEISDNAKSCPNCGYQLSPLKKSQLKIEPSKKNQIGCLVTFAIIIFIISLIIFGDSKDSTPWYERDNVLEAFVMAQEFVKKQLVSPSTAKFPFNYKDFTTRLEGQKYKIVSYVDSQNRMGAMIRSNFSVTLEQVEEEQWKLIDIQITE